MKVQLAVLQDIAVCEKGKPFVRMGLLESLDSSTVYIMYTDKAKGPSAFLLR